MKKECRIVMLPVEKAELFEGVTCIVRHSNRFDYSLQYVKSLEDGIKLLPSTSLLGYDSYPYPNEHIKRQHLYLLSSDEIEEGDWCVRRNMLHRYVRKAGGRDPWFKIIATTDPKLTGIQSNGMKLCKHKEWDSLHIGRPSCDGTCTLPQFSEDLIKDYVKAGGRGKVMVEYEEHIGPYSSRWYTPKVRERNIVITSQVRDSYTREEVIKIIQDFCNVNNIDRQYASEYIDKNL